MYGRRDIQYGPTGNGVDFMESRRLQRERLVVNVWPQSPKEPARELSPKRSRSKKISKRRRGGSDTSSNSSDSEEGRLRRERKERKRARRALEREERKERRRRPSRDLNEDSDRARRHTGRSRSPVAVVQTLQNQTREISTGPPPSSKDDSEEDMGPVPVQAPKGNKRVDERAYGTALLRGEGSAMAAFLKEGTDVRIPRRGEIGLTSEQIASFEDVGYVMSGSRHRRMNAVRMRKENQVISAEEKRGILKLQKEERERRESILREEFGELVNEKLKASTAVAPSTSEK